MGNTSGSIRKANIGGIPYNVAADANASKTPEETNEAVRHSGGNMKKVTFNPGQVESMTLVLQPEEYDVLKEQAKEEDLTLSYTLADGSTWRSNGWITLDNYESEENRCDVTMTPKLGTWDLFAS